MTISTLKQTFFSERELKKALRDIEASGVVWALIDNGKLANQIATFVAIVVKSVYDDFRNSYWKVTISYMPCKIDCAAVLEVRFMIPYRTSCEKVKLFGQASIRQSETGIE